MHASKYKILAGTAQENGEFAGNDRPKPGPVDIT
jgi:hypothetical protein